MHTAEFSLFARINDERALIKGARRHAMRANAMTAREAIKLIDGVKAALIQFLDPGVPPHPASKSSNPPAKPTGINKT